MKDVLSHESFSEVTPPKLTSVYEVGLDGGNEHNDDSGGDNHSCH